MIFILLVSDWESFKQYSLKKVLLQLWVFITSCLASYQMYDFLFEICSSVC
jgi:hypothetical protein